MHTKQASLMNSRQEFNGRQEYSAKTGQPQTIQTRQGRVQMSHHDRSRGRDEEAPENNSRLEFTKRPREDWVETSQKMINDEYHESMKKI